MEATKDRWCEWGKYYCTMFGWKAESETQMVLIWIGHFRRWGYTAEELFSATALVAKRDNPIVKREDHFSYLRQALHTVRRENTKVEPVPNDYRGVCVFCGDTGAVSVPLLRDVHGDQWNSTRTSAVWCSCPAGKKYVGTSTNSNRSMMGLAEYTRKNPCWKLQKDRKQQQDREADLLFSEAVDLNRRGQTNEFDRLRVKLMERFGLLKITEAKHEKERSAGVGTNGQAVDEGVDLPF